MARLGWQTAACQPVVRTNPNVVICRLPEAMQQGILAQDIKKME